jgi:hypothetical protein
LLGNRCVLQQQHIDCKIADALLKKDAFSQERQGLWLPKDDLQDSSSWSSPRFCSSVTSTPSFLPTMTERRAVRRLSHRLM